MEVGYELVYRLQAFAWLLLAGQKPEVAHSAA
jgi:hypothetical protein